MNIKELERELCSYGIEDGRGEAYLIVEHLFGVSRTKILLDRDMDFASQELDEVLKKRKDRVPLQYIFGEWEFMGNNFLVSQDCLIPQPDTEILTEKAIEILKKWQGVDEINAKCKMQNAKLTTFPSHECDTSPYTGEATPHPSAEPTPSPQGEGSYDRAVTEATGLDLLTRSSKTVRVFDAPCAPTIECEVRNAKCDARVADLCTGSGCIGLSLLLHGATDRVMLMDISEGALSMARKNARLHGAEDRCDFVLGDICRDLPKRKYKMIVSNPPYIPTKDIEGLPEEVKKEPRLALDGGDDGLDLIRFLIGDGLSGLDENGVMLIEFGFDQGEIMDALLREKRDTGSIKSYEILRDYGNNPRVAVIYGN